MNWLMSMVLTDSKARDLKFATAIESSNQIQNLFKLYTNNITCYSNYKYHLCSVKTDGIRSDSPKG